MNLWTRFILWANGVKGPCPKCGSTRIWVSKGDVDHGTSSTVYCANCLNYRAGYKHSGVFR